jgi:hypothetical protein
VFDFIKKVFNQKKPAPVIIAFASIPAWVAGQEESSRTTLEESAKAPVQNIRNSAAQLQHIVNSISGAEHDPALHPKVRAVAKNSLPLYIKAMNSALAKPLSGDIEEFYTDAVECLTSSLKANRGQGRYLQAVFPDEMKAVKISVDTMGREMNLLTAALAAFRKRKAAIDAVTALHRSVVELQEDLQRSGEKDQRVTARISEITGRIGAIEAEENALASDAKGKREIEECRTLLAEKEKTRDEVIRNYTSRTMTASHVFKKAEKIAAKQNHTADVVSLRGAVELLSDHELPDASRLTAALITACPVAQTLINAGEIPLKNREEREVFSDTQQFCIRMAELCTELTSCDEACRNAEKTLSAHPLAVRSNSLIREKTQLSNMLKKETELHFELVEWNAKTSDKIPSLTEELRKKIEGIMGVSVQFQAGTDAPVRG